MNIKKNQEKLIAEGYEILHCPRCDQECKPTRLNKSGSVTYEPHVCQNGYELEPRKRSFRINATGDLVMK